MIASSLHYKLWLKHIGYRVGVGEDFVKKRRTIKMIDEGLENIFNDLSHTKVLILNGDQDDRICLATENETIKEFRQAHKGREGVDWDYMTLPVKGHRLSSAYVVQAMKWAQKWVTSKTEFIEAKL
jgi:hypothetical protein